MNNLQYIAILCTYNIRLRNDRASQEQDYSLEVEQDQCKVQLKECQDNTVLKEENSMPKEKLKHLQEPKSLNQHTMSKLV